MWKLIRLERARKRISELLAEGTQITLTVDDKVIQGRTAIKEWCEKVELVLREYLDESYVTRFHLGGSNIQGSDAMSVWKNNHRLETLARFLTELK
jgi:hypothetical protein